MSSPWLEALKALIWPSVGLVLGLVFLALLFGTDTGKKLLQRIKEITLDKWSIKLIPYGQSPVDERSLQPPPGSKTESVGKGEQLEDDTINWSWSGDLFWVAHDLMFTIDLLLRGASKDYIDGGLRQSLWHVYRLGLKGTPSGSKLARLKAEAEELLAQDWTRSRRNRYASDLKSIIRAIGDLAEANQGEDFVSSPPPDWVNCLPLQNSSKQTSTRQLPVCCCPRSVI